MLESHGLANLDAIESAIRRSRIDCDFERTGVIDVATKASLVADLQDDMRHPTELGQDIEFFDRDAIRAEIHSPTYHAGLWRKGRAAIVDPARLVWGMKVAAHRAGCAHL